MPETASNIVWHEGHVSAANREELLGQRGCVVWFTGLSGSGKSTIATALEAELIASGHAAYLLDGDNIRHGLNGDLGFTPEARVENIRRISEVAALFADAGLITLTAFISPYRADRRAARDKVTQTRFVEVFLDVPLDVCESRDPKQLYARARAGEIADFTGISAPYEPPESPELTLATSEMPVDACVEKIRTYLLDQGLLIAAQ